MVNGEGFVPVMFRDYIIGWVYFDEKYILNKFFQPFLGTFPQASTVVTSKKNFLPFFFTFA
jgi:hypothetical protein